MPSLTAWLAAVSLGLCGVVWTLCLLGWRAARTRYRHEPITSRLDQLPAESVPGVSIIRPLCGLDMNLFNALESAMLLEYPNYEVIFAIQSPEDEALPVVKMVMAKHKDVPAKIKIDDRIVGTNMKVNNLVGAFEEAQNDLLWIMDSTISVQPGSLGRAVQAMLPRMDIEAAPSTAYHTPERGDVGLVHHVPFAVLNQRSWGSLVEQAFLNATHAKMYLAINALAIDSCVMGKSNLYSKGNIASLESPSKRFRETHPGETGLAGFGPYIAEDNMIALGLWHQLGLKHLMNADIAMDCLGALSLRQYVQRRVRWIRVRRRMTPLPVVLLEPFTESILCGLLGAWAAATLFGTSKAATLGIHIILWYLIDLDVCRSLARGRGAARFHPLAWAFREVTTLVIWVLAMFGNEIEWRGRRYRILTNGEAVRIS